MRQATSMMVVTALAATAMAGCGSSNGGQADSSGKGGDKAAKIAYITSAFTDFPQAEIKGVKQAVADGGGAVTVFNANFDAGKQQQQCADAVSSGRYNAVVLSPVSAVTAVPCVRAASAAKLPVISMESPAGNDPNAIEPTLDGVVGAVVLIPSFAAGQVAGLVKSACEGRSPCRVIAEDVPGDPFTTATNKRIAQLLNVQIVQKLAGMYDPALIQKNLPDALSAHADADVFLAASDTEALAALGPISSAKRQGKIRVVGVGGSRRGAEAVAAGTMFATTGGWPIQAGRLAGQMAIKAINGQSIAPKGINSALIDQPLEVTPKTVGTFKAEW
jgi:ribose transport system substrate-binding protein